MIHHIEVYGDPDPALEANWSTISTDGRAATNVGGGLTHGDSTLYFVYGDGAATIDPYTPGSGWGSQLTAPRGLDVGSATTADDSGNLWALRADEFLGGFNATVHAIAYVSSNKIYVGGEFTQAGSTAANYIAEWDGSQWRQMGVNDPNAPDATVYAIAVSGSNVYVGGTFGLRRWNGSSWAHLGGVTVAVYALVADGTDVYVGGDMEYVTPPGGGALLVNGIAKWSNGWYKVGIYGGYSGLISNPAVYALAVDSNYVYVGGRFYGGYGNSPPNTPNLYSSGLILLNKNTNTWVRAGNDNCAGVWKEWEGHPGSMLYSSVSSLAMRDGHLVVGCPFDHVANTCDADLPANHLAYFHSIVKWMPQSFLSTNGNVRTIGVSGNNIYIGGEFTKVGAGDSTLAPYVAHLNASDEWNGLGSGTNNHVYAVAHDGANTYVGGAFTWADDGTESGPVNHFARWDGSRWNGQFFYQYSGGSWSLMPELPTRLGEGAAAVSIKTGSYDGYLFALAGGGSAGFYRFKDGAWHTMANLPGEVREDAALIEGNLHSSGYSYIYASRGGNTPDFYRFDPNFNNWTVLAPLPSAVFSAGASLAWDGRDWIYAFVGGNGKHYLRYHIPTNQWQVLGDGSSLTPDDKDTPGGVNAGGGLALIGNELYGVPGGGDAQLWRYDPVGVYPEKLALDQVAFVAPETAATPSWYNLDLTIQPDDFMLVGNDNAWVGGSATTWSPDPSSDPPLNGSSQLTHDQAQFVDAVRDVYRIRDGSVLNAGYHTYRATAYVAPSGEEFTNIQEAILSGANSVIVRPGQYPQSFYLISGVNVLGSRADQTILEAPPGHTDPLVTAEGVVGARLSGFTLAGDGNQDGLRVEDGAQSITFGRNIVRGTGMGISVVGSDTDLEVVNNTIVENTNGMVASACAPVDMRNTIFAYHSGTGLAYDTLPADPAAHWPLDEAAGATSFADASGNGHTATCSGANCPTAGVAGHHGNALLFDGLNDYVTADTANPDDLQQLTIAAWVNFNSLPANDIMRFVTLESEKAVLRYDTKAGPGLHFYMNINGSLQSIRVDNALQTGTWYHVAGTYDGHEMRLYLDGELAGRHAIEGTVGGGTGVRLSHSTETLEGLLDDVRLYDRALSADEVLALSGGCSPAYLHTYNDFWANGADLSPAEPGAGEMFLDPMFVDRFAHDYRTMDGSPVVDAGNPTDPAPPGTGDRVDIGYIEQGRAAYYADDDYCETCANDGLTWQVDAFDIIQDALDAAADYIQTLRVLETLRVSVGVGPGTYIEHVSVPSYVQLVGSGAEDTTIDAGGSGSPVTFSGVVQAEISNFTLTGAGSPGIAVTGASNAITITRNIIRDNPTGVAFSGRSTGVASFNTLVNNSGDGISSSGTATWVNVENNILSNNSVGLHTLDNGQIFNDYNLLNNTSNYNGPAQGPNELVGVDPLFVDAGAGNYRLQPASPAVDAASPFAEVPAGGGERADLGYRELLAAPVSVFLGKEDVSTATGNSGVSEVEFGITLVADPSQPVTETLPSSWSAVTLDSPQETVSYWQTDYTPADEGLHRFYSRATDVVGNQETEEEDWYEGAFVADDTPPVVTWLSPADGTSLSSPLELRAEASDYAAGEFSVEDIHFEVDRNSYSAEWAAVPWDEENGDPRVFRAWVSLDNGNYNVVAVAEDKAGHVGQSAPSIALTVSGQSAADTTLPNLVITSPAAGDWVTSTVTFSGTASDGESGLASVEVSVDGGYTWMPATVQAAAQTSEVCQTSEVSWSLEWEAPDDQEYVSYPAWARASDRAGNSTSEARVFTVDNVAPTGLAPVTFSAPQGTHFDATTTLTITWNTPEDGSGTAFVVLAADQITDTTPTQQVPGTTATVPLALSGDWYVHIGAKDAAGNQFTRHFGPWHVGTFDDPGQACGQREQSILLDGYLDLANGEWRDTEFLDDDERPAETQSLYATWDGTAFYLAWQGAWWLLDGTLWACLDTGPGGSNQPVNPLSSGTLPFDADYAIEVTSPDSGALWTYNGGWQPGPLEFAQGESGGTEVRLPLDIPQISDLRLIAFALDDDGEPWSVFPTTNPLAGPWSQSYAWSDLCNVSDPNDGQPQGINVEMALSSPQAPQAAWGPGNFLEYVVDLTNQEADEVTGLQLAFSTTTGLAYQTVDGATCADCTANDNWLLNVPPLPAGAGHRITVTGQLATDLSGLSSVTTTVALKFDTATLGEASLGHRVDGQPPTVSVSRAGETIKPGLQTIYGQASDGDGIGVGNVQARQAGTGTWLDASGTLLWSFEVAVPLAPTFQLEAQAKDQHDQTSDVVLAEFTVDAMPPVVNWSLPAILSGDYAEIGGTTADPYPVGGEVNQVEVQLDQDTVPWQVAQVYAPDASGSHSWLWTWDLPREDGVPHTLRVRATDVVSNTSPASDWQSTLVDTVAPEVTVTNVISEATLGDYPLMSAPGQPILEGTADDGDSVSDVIVHVNLPNGDSYQDQATQHSAEWSYTPELTQCGHHTLRLEVTDRAGNASLEGPFDLFVDAPGLEVAFVTAEPTDSISLTARVRNDGGKQAPAGVSVAFYLGDPEAGGTFIGTTATTQALDPGEWEDVSVTWDTDTPGDHDIYIVADDDGTGTSQIAECEEDNNTTHHTVSILDVPLVESWNLMSGYVNPFNTDTSVVQRPISGAYVVIQGFDGEAQSYYPDLPPAVNSLKDMDAEHGYWIKANAGTSPTLRVVGEKFAEDRAIELDAGWNLVSYLPRQPLAVADALQSIDGQYAAVLGYDQGALSYYPDIDPSFNTLREMEPPFGYWIKMALSVTLQYPTTGGGQVLDIGYSQSLISNIRQAEHSAGVTLSNTWVNFYGPAHWPDGTPLPVGTTVLTLDSDGVVCGATVVTTEGQYGLLACYGDDPTTPEDEGAQPGDAIQLIVDDQVLATGAWTAHGERQWKPLGKAEEWQVYLPLIRKGEDGRWKEEDGE